MRTISRADALASGLRRYFTGRACKYGHVAERAVCDHSCVECSRLDARRPEVRESRREYMREHQIKWRKKNPDRWKSIKAKRKEADTIARREYRAKNPEKDRAALRRSFQKHKAKRMAETRAWKAANPEAWSRMQRAAKARRRGLEYAAVGSYTQQDVEQMIKAQNFICAACPVDITDCYHVDHMTPLSRGGTNWPDNLQLLCGRCNRSKGPKTMQEWLAWKEIHIQGITLQAPRS